MRGRAPIRGQTRCGPEQKPLRADGVPAQLMRTPHCELGQRLPQPSFRRVVGRLPRVLEDFVGVKRATRVEQSLRLVQGLFGVTDHALGQARNPGGPIWQRSAKPITGTRAARPTSQISVTFHQLSVTIYRGCLHRPATPIPPAGCRPICFGPVSDARSRRGKGAQPRREARGSAHHPSRLPPQ